MLTTNRIKVYLDTSAISYLDQQDAPEKMQETREVWDCLKAERYDIYISDVIVSWNFKHIVNVKTMRGIKVITTLEGYKDLLIYPPSALLEDEEENDE